MSFFIHFFLLLYPFYLFANPCSYQLEASDTLYFEGIDLRNISQEQERLITQLGFGSNLFSAADLKHPLLRNIDHTNMNLSLVKVDAMTQANDILINLWPDQGKSSPVVYSGDQFYSEVLSKNLLSELQAKNRIGNFLFSTNFSEHVQYIPRQFHDKINKNYFNLPADVFVSAAIKVLAEDYNISDENKNYLLIELMV